MSEIEFETLEDVPVQDILDARTVEVVVTNFRGTFNEDGLELEGYTLECEDEIDLCDILNLAYDVPVVCERRDVENSITKAEYETLKISDDRRGAELAELQQKASGLLKSNQSMFKIIKDRDNKLSDLRDQLAARNKPWWSKLSSKLVVK